MNGKTPGRDEMRADIINAFSNAVQPERTALVRGQSLEASMVRNFLSPRNWIQLDNNALKDYDSRADLSAAIFFLSAEGMAYYMPSFLLFIIDKPSSSGLLLEVLCSQFKEGKGAFLPSSYTIEQQLAISDTLTFIARDCKRDADMIQAVAEARDAWLGNGAASSE